jgi:proteasome activator subunit 4
MDFISNLSHFAPFNLPNATQSHDDMDDDDFSDALDLDALSSMDKQLASLKTYTNSLPYASSVESVEHMQAVLEQIVGKIYICAKTKNWLLLTSWDGMLQWFLLPY